MAINMKQKSSFTEGKIAVPLLRFAVPVLIAMCLQSLYGAVDMLVVGRFGNAADVSAVATGSQMMQLVTTLFTGLAMGTTIILGQMIGAENNKESGDVIGGSICFFLTLSFVVTAVMLCVATPFAQLMQTPEEAFSQTTDYVRICSAGIVFIVAYNVLGSIFRGMGDSKTPLLTVVIACVFNIVGDLFFVGVLQMRASGAAIATIMAQALSVIISILFIKRKGLPFSFGRKNIRFHKTVIARIFKTGAPIALQDSLVMVSFLAINSIVNGLGVVFSAGVGVAEKICAFIMLMPMAFSQSLSAFVAQNIGAGNHIRARKSMECAMGMSIVAGVILAYLAYFHGTLLGSAFTTDTEVIMASADYMKAYAIDTLMVSFLFCFVGYFNGCGNTVFVMLQGLVGAFLVRIPVSWLMSRVPDTNLFMIGLATPASTVVQMILCVVWFLFILKKRR